VNRFVDEDADPPGRGYSGRQSGVADAEPADREISLGTPTILGIFFALALVCACFFGFGYTLGRKSVPTASVPAESAPGTLGAAKPTAGSPANSAARTSDVVPGPSVTVPTDTAATPASSNSKGITPADGMIVGDKPVVQQPVAAPPPPGTFMVQVAAVSSQDVADIELAALAKKGYNVAVHHEPQDKLLHIQIGPFTDRKEAEAMRQRVLADGFNAIVK
jgi:DedD protein